ncbi:MAG TPA: hypothetical protein VGE24_12705 [Emticicia sp.]
MGKQYDTDGFVMHEWRHYLSPNEIQERKDTSVKLSDEIDKIEDEKKSVMDEFKAKLKDRKRLEKMARLEAKTGHIDKYDKVKPVMDFARGIVEFFDQNGDKVDERKMTRQEQKEGAFINN